MAVDRCANELQLRFLDGPFRPAYLPDIAALKPDLETLTPQGEKATPAIFRPFEKWSNVHFWKRQVRTWHWMSGAISLIGMMLFALTGITLNHAADIPATPRIVEREFILSSEILNLLSVDAMPEGTETLPRALQLEIRSELGVDIAGANTEWTDVDAYISLPRPGGDAWLSVDRETGDVIYEVTSRGGVAYFNDLHKGRNTGAAWSWFLDIFAVACIIFCASGLWLLQMHSARRGSTWFLVAGGLAIPALLLIVFVHM